MYKRQALQNLTLQTGLIPTYSHNAMVVFSKQCAQEGLIDVFDFFIRYHETRPTVDLFVAQDLSLIHIYVASALKKQHCNVHVIMTENATNFITPITFEELTGNKCVVHTFDRNFQHNVEHVRCV